MTARSRPAGRSMRAAAGFTIIEFMIAMTLSLIVLAALTAAFVASSRSRAEIEKANEQIENGRFALQILTDDLEMAGFYSHLDLDIALGADLPMVMPTAKINPCVTAVSLAGVDNDLVDALPLHIQGYDALGALGALNCLADFKPGTDIVAIRRAATCVAGTANCAVTVGAPYLQASLCSTHLNDAAAVNYFELELAADAGSPPGNLGRTKRDCATRAEGRQYLTHIYFVAHSDVVCTTVAGCSALGVVGQNCVGTAALDGDCIPTLKRAELGNALAPGGFTTVPLAHGVQDLQLEYGIDTTDDGAPEAFVADPDTYNGGNCAGTVAEKNQCVANWRNVMVVRLNLLARNSSATKDYTDSKEYSLGLDADGGVQCALDANDDDDCEAFNDAFKRHVYQTSVRLNNPSGRREQ